MPTCTVNLSKDQAFFVDESIRRRGFMNSSAVVRAALQLLERQLAEPANGPLAGGAPVTPEQATEMVDAIMRRVERTSAFEDKLTALIDSVVRSGDYPNATDVLAAMVRYVEMRLDREQPSPEDRHLRMLEAPASEPRERD